MTFSRFQDDDGNESDSTDEQRVFPRLTPVEDGDVEFRSRGTVGRLHLLEDEGALAYGVTKKDRFNKYNGYAVSVDILKTLPEHAAELREAGTVPETAEVEYIFFFLPQDREVLQFTLDQYLNAEYEYTNTERGGYRDVQNIVEEDEAIRTWTDGYSHIVKDPDYYHGYASV